MYIERYIYMDRDRMYIYICVYIDILLVSTSCCTISKKNSTNLVRPSFKV